MTGPALEVLDGGLLTTVQDAGRPDWTHLGVPASGAADPWSLAVANLLVGNDPGRAALEMTLVGPTLVVRGAITVGLAGADLGARIRDGRRLAPGRSHRLGAGDFVEIPGDSRSLPSTGARAYLAVPGGVDVPLVLGSRSTCLAGGFGGLDGRALRLGDGIWPALAAAAGSAPVGAVRPELVWPEADGADRFDAVVTPATLRVVVGPAPGLDALGTIDWRVGTAANRVGIRLDGEPLPDGIGGETTTHGVPWGAIQVPPDGRPIILGADHQTTGGYRVVAVVISADLAVLGQLRPGASLRLVAVDRPAALRALRARRDALSAGAAALRDAAGWDALIDSAGG
ncbi:MAG TPA: biotin-dependent carboxyltransferase family protein [Candidatus Limnocylindrales bacterium]|nr:biotin-dependent carboxyltransferase family protein [Candidatus Limnocylindrales bacterium]